MAGRALIGIGATGLDRLQTAIAAREARLADLSPALSEIGVDFHAWQREVFASEGGATAAGPWAPLDERYAEWKARRSPGGTLVFSGHLEETLTTPSPQSIFEVGPTMLIVGTALMTPDGRWNLGMIHQEGTSHGLPARPLIDVPTARMAAWVGMVRAYLEPE